MSAAGQDGHSQGLKPIDFIGFIGTTEVVPCYRAPIEGVLRRPLRPVFQNLEEVIICHMAVGPLTSILKVEGETGEHRVFASGGAETESKMRALEARLGELGSLMVAYSGGVDSAFLAATAHRVLGSRMLAVLADSPSLARRDMEQASAFALEQEMPLQVIQTEELDRPEYQRNDANRCFHRS